VPGFVFKDGNDGRPYLTLAGAAGLLVPVRDALGNIVALQVRHDDPAADGAADGDEAEAADGPAPTTGTRYSFVSGTSYGGPSPGSPAHVPAGVVAGPEVRLTEGALKADVATARSGLLTVGASGVTGWRAVLDAARRLGATAVRLAFDADCRTKAQVARALGDCYEDARARGLAVKLERWDAADGKGIDDLLAAGEQPEVLAGDAAREAIAEIVAAFDPLRLAKETVERLDDVLKGGAEALFRDKELLAALARLAEEDSAEYAGIRARLRRAKVNLTDLNAALSPFREAVRREKPPPDHAGGYRVVGGRIVWEVQTEDGVKEIPLANFEARVVEQVTLDDGADRSVRLAVEGSLQDGTPLPRVEIAAAEFSRLEWVVTSWGTRACPLPGQGYKDRLRAAVQLLSGDVPCRTVYGHLGWREIGGRWLYLHAGGAVGPDGPGEGVEVSVPDALTPYTLPDPPRGPALVRAVRASLGVLRLGPDRLAYPLLAAVYRVVLGACDFALHLCGPTGAGKSERAALCQQHFGAGMDRLHLPGSWLGTGNSQEALAFAAKDAVLVVDDFAPGGAADVARAHREADRLLRAQGNRSGRGRCKVDGSLRAAKPPRGLIVSTGEDVPRGQSLRSRLLALETTADDMNWQALTACQEDAAAGLYAQALAAFLSWLAPRYGEVRDGLDAARSGLRALAAAAGQHARTPGIVADLALGLHHLLDFAREVGAVDAATAAAHWERGWAALCEAAAAQDEHVRSAEPVGHFLRLLNTALASGEAHVAGTDGVTFYVPDNPAAWGWREAKIGGDDYRLEWQPRGKRIGWADGKHLYLDPGAAYAVAQALARTQGETQPVGDRTLWRRLHEQGLLTAVDAQEDGTTRFAVRRRLEGRRRSVLCLRADVLEG
jgi:hypothetical protein